MSAPRPRFAPQFEVWRIPSKAIVLTSSSGHLILRGALPLALAPLVDGQRTADEIVDALAPQFPATDVYFALERMRGFTVPSEAAGVASPRVDSALPTAGDPIAIVALGQISPAPLIRALDALAIPVASEAQSWIVLTPDYLHADLAAWAQRASEHGWTWLPVRPAGGALWMGPQRGPSHPCFECLQRRLRAARSVERVLERIGERLFSPDPIFDDNSAGVAARRIAAWLRAYDAFHSLVVIDGSTRTHALVPCADCSTCGAAPVLAPASASSAEDMLARLAPWVSPILGVVGHVRSWPTIGGVWKAAARGATEWSGDLDLEGAIRQWGRGGVGTGSTEAEARVKALAECLEMDSARFRGVEPRRRARWADMGGDAIHPSACVPVSAAQFASRDAWNEAWPAPRHFIPAPFDEGLEIDWSPVWSLTERRVRWLPTALCYLDYPQAPFGRADSTGNAAAATLADAILHGLLEVIERDAAAIWWYNRACRPALDLERLDDPAIDRVRAGLDERGRELWVLDVTTDFNVPVFVCVSRQKTRPADFRLGFGAHLNPRIAARHAVFENIQALEVEVRDAGHIRIAASLEEKHAWLLADGKSPVRHVEAASTRAVNDDIDDLVGRARRQNLEVLTLDLTRADSGLHVARVVVPGMRSMSPHFGPGRLYDVPAGLQWIRSEDGMNPLPLPS